jgi:hypothetical protein
LTISDYSLRIFISVEDTYTYRVVKSLGREVGGLSGRVTARRYARCRYGTAVQLDALVDRRWCGPWMLGFPVERLVLSNGFLQCKTEDTLDDMTLSVCIQALFGYMSIC